MKGRNEEWPESRKSMSSRKTEQQKLNGQISAKDMKSEDRNQE